MSTQNSTGDKLVASVRKTKSATATPKTTKKKVVKKTASRSIKAQAPAKKTENTKKQLVDLFQSGRRVWPD